MKERSISRRKTGKLLRKLSFLAAILSQYDFATVELCERAAKDEGSKSCKKSD